MKRILFGFLLLILMGAGCVGTQQGEDTTQKNSNSAWWLSFDLPQDWVLVNHYSAATDTLPTADTITARSTDIVLQSTDLPIAVDGEVSDTWGQSVSSDYAYLRVFRYSHLKPLPDDAVDIGDGFYQSELDGQTVYWYPMEFGNYLFTIQTDGNQDMEQIKQIIFSAQEHDLSDQL